MKQEVVTVGLDLAKSVFQVHAIGRDGAVLVRRKLRRAPVVTRGLVAERLMYGSLLQEVLRPADDVGRHAVARTDMLAYNRLEGQWGYVSFDTRAPVGLMPAWSSGAGDPASISLSFTPFAVPGAGADAGGQLLRMEQVIRFTDAAHDVKDQYFTLADGTGTRWLAHRYAYTRRG